MATRKFDFITGIETSNAPVASDPVDPADPTTLGFSDARYVQGDVGVEDIAALKAKDTTLRQDKDAVMVESKNAFYRYEAASTDVADDDFIVEPAGAVGRWFKLTDFDTAGGLTVTGDLTVTGTTTTLNTATLDVTDANVTVNNGGDQASAAGAGLTVEMSDATDSVLSYDSTLESKFKLGESGSEGEVITATHDQTITGQKTIGGASGNVEFIEVASTPSTPPSGFRRFYADNLGFKQVDDTGFVSEIGGGGGLSTQLLSSTATLQNNVHYLSDTSGGAFAVTLPVGTTGAIIRVSDSLSSWETNNLTVNADGAELINGESDLVLDINGAWVQFMWNGTEWKTDDNLDKTNPFNFIADTIKWQKKELTSNVTTNNTDFLSFNGLTVDKFYRFSGAVVLSTGNSGYIEAHVKEGANILQAMIRQNLGSASGTGQSTAGFNVVFRATSTTCTLHTNALGAGDLIRSSDVSGEIGTYATLEELPTHIETTDFT